LKARWPWQITGMDDSALLACLAVDYGDLRDAVTAVELTTPVPSCPGHDAVRVAGDPAWADYLRRMLAAVTQ